MQAKPWLVVFLLTSLIVPLIWVVASPQLAQAAGVVGSGTPASCTEAAFTTRLGGGGNVTFNCGGAKTIVVVNQKMITQSTTIDGGGQITLTGGLVTRLFFVSNGVTLTLRNIVLDSFYSAGASGGAIVNNGTLVLDNSTIQFSQTDVNHGGGAIFSNGPVFIANSTLKKNSAGLGGALLLQNNADTQITNSRFEDNKTLNITSGYGGAIWVKPGTTLNAVDTRFERNTAQFGGAVYVSAGGKASFSGQAAGYYTSVFQSNVVTTTNNSNPCSVSLPCSGGAIYSEGDLDVDTLEFFGNRAPDTVSLAGSGLGGAIASYGTLRVNGVSFAVNKANYGGGLFAGSLAGAPLNSARASVQESSFQSNSARVLGGALFTNNYTTVVTATHSFFLGNSTNDSGGAVARVNATLNLVDSTFLVNQAATAGGGLYVAADDTGDPSRVLVQSTTFDGNTVSNASKAGGGIANGHNGSSFPFGGIALLENVTLISNTNGIFNGAGVVHTNLTNTVLSNGPSLNCDNAGTPITSNGHNFSSDTSCALGGSGDQQGSGQDPKLGSSQCDIRQCYRLPLAGSPLINTGSGCPPLDQRGAPRVGICDKGAVEFGGLWRHLWLPAIRR